MIYTYASLSCSRLCLAWRPLRAWSYLVTSDAHEALFGYDHLESIFGCRVTLYIPFPFHFMRCYAYHVYSRHPLAFYASLHTCSHVHALVLLASASSMLQHNEVMDIRSKPTFVPRGHHFLFAFLLVFLACLLAFLFLCLPCLSWLLLYASFICSLHIFLSLLVCWFLVFVFACTHMEWGRMELRHGLLDASIKGKDVSMWI